MKTALAPALLVAFGLGSLGALEAVRAQAPNARAHVEDVTRKLESDPAKRKLTQNIVARARQALARAKGARDAGDHRHAAELEALAFELADTATDWVRAAEAETAVGAIEQRVLDAEARVVRARALVEQTAARRGRASEQLQALEQEKSKDKSQSAKPSPSESKP